MYTEGLKIYGINEKINTTCFTERLVESVPNLQSETVHGKIRLVFNSKVKDLLSEYVKSPDDFFLSIQSFSSPICQEKAQQSYKFDGSFDNSSQFDSVPRSLVYLISSLIDRSSPTEN